MKYLANILIFFLLTSPAMAFSLDASVDDTIRKNFNPSKLEDDMLPPLPKTIGTSTNEMVVPDYEKPPTSINTQKITPKNVQPKNIATKSLPPQNAAPKNAAQNLQPQMQPANIGSAPVSGSFATLKRGTKFRVKLLTNVSDRNRKGARFTLQNLYPVTTTYLTVPSGALFKGEITDVHPPQLSGNGGLIVMDIDSLIIDGKKYNLSGRVTRADYRKIFFNNIKGKRTYLANTINASSAGRKYFHKMWNLTCDFANDGGTVILSPFPVIIGTIASGANILASPAISAFKSGKSIKIPSGALFEIKLNQQAIIYQ